jgi:transposase
MGNIKRKLSPSFKAKVALELIREKETIASICSRHSVHPTQAGRWKEAVVKGLESTFTNNNGTELKHKDELIDDLYREVGKRDIELEWLKKKIESVR